MKRTTNVAPSDDGAMVREAELLKEMKQRLVADVVTGQSERPALAGPKEGES